MESMNVEDGCMFIYEHFKSVNAMFKQGLLTCHCQNIMASFRSDKWAMYYLFEAHLFQGEQDEPINYGYQPM